jgi:hypothetical protein
MRKLVLWGAGVVAAGVLSTLGLVYSIDAYRPTRVDLDFTVLSLSGDGIGYNSLSGKSVNLCIMDELHYNTKAFSRGGIYGEVVMLDGTQQINNVKGVKFGMDVTERKDGDIIDMLNLSTGKHNLSYKVLNRDNRWTEVKRNFSVKDVK